MLGKSIRAAIGALAIAAFTFIGGTNQAHAQDMTSRLYPTPQESSHLVWGFGGGVNSNMAYGTYNPDGTAISGSRNGTDFRPEGHLLLEVPIAGDLSFAPRISYQNLGTRLNRQSGSTLSASQSTAVGYQTLGVDALLKYNIASSPAYIIGGVGVGEAVKRSYQTGTASDASANMSNQEMPNAPLVLPTAQAGIGFDIPVRSNEMWISPEVTYTKPLMNLAQGSNDGSLDISTISTKVSMKFAIH